MKPWLSTTKPEPRLRCLCGRPCGGPKKRSNGPKYSPNGSGAPGPPGPPPPGPPSNPGPCGVLLVEMLTTAGDTRSTSVRKSGSVTVGGGDDSGVLLLPKNPE